MCLKIVFFPEGTTTVRTRRITTFPSGRIIGSVVVRSPLENMGALYINWYLRDDEGDGMAGE